jgi:hypothetical protein
VGQVTGPIVASADELDEAWLSNVLGTPVRSVAAERIGAGQTSSTCRLTIDAEGLPPTLIAKFAQGDHAARQRVATAHRAEVGFYAQMADRVDLTTPKCWHASLSEDASAFTLVLEDLSPRQIGRQIDGCTPGQARAGVEVLAALHASSWRDPALQELDFLVPLTEERAAFLGGLVAGATELFVERFAGEVSEADVETLRHAAKVIVDFQRWGAEHFSVIHADFRLDNLMFAPDSDEVVAVDWQTVTVAHPGRDLAYFLETSLPTPVRVAHEVDLVASYHRALVERGVEGLSLDDCFASYRVGLLHGAMITVLGVMTSAEVLEASAREMFASMAVRSCAAIRDHDPFELLGDR